MSWEKALLMKLSNDVEKYEIEVTKMGENYSFFLQCTFYSVTRCRIADQPKQRNKVGMIAVQYRTPPYISFHI